MMRSILSSNTDVSIVFSPGVAMHSVTQHGAGLNPECTPSILPRGGKFQPQLEGIRAEL